MQTQIVKLFNILFASVKCQSVGFKYLPIRVGIWFIYSKSYWCHAFIVAIEFNSVFFFSRSSWDKNLLRVLPRCPSTFLLSAMSGRSSILLFGTKPLHPTEPVPQLRHNVTVTPNQTTHSIMIRFLLDTADTNKISCTVCFGSLLIRWVQM